MSSFSSLFYGLYSWTYATLNSKNFAGKILDDYELLKAKHNETMPDLFSSQLYLEKSQQRVAKLEAKLHNSRDLNDSLNDLFINSETSLEKQMTKFQEIESQ